MILCMICGKNELVSLKASELEDVSEVRRLRLELDEEISATSLKSLSNAEKLRTIFLLEGSSLDPATFSNNKHLRVLHVDESADSDYLELHHLSFKLKHLRYLRLCYLDLSEVIYDQSISKLYNLETLVLTKMDIGVQNLLQNIQSLKKLRHLEVSWTDMEELPDSVTSLCNLQTLDLNHCELKALPESATGLKNLKSLDISFNPIEELPAFIINLHNLQTLNVSSCESLKSLPEFLKSLHNLEVLDLKDCVLIKTLPKDLGELIHLRYLNLSNTDIEVFPESCANLVNLEFVWFSSCKLPKEMNNWINPRRFYSWDSVLVGMGKLVRLEELTYQVTEKILNDPDRSEGIEGLQNLDFLEELTIFCLHNVKDPNDAERANLKGKQNLCKLKLFWGLEEESSDMLWDEKSCNFLVFEALQPHTGLRDLEIHNFMGCNLPTWMCVPSSFPYLECLEFGNCQKIEELPAVIGQLPRLWHLSLDRLSFESLDIVGFPSLTNLYLSDMFYLEDILCSHPLLQVLKIDNCDSLTEIPLFPSLDALELKYIDEQLVSSVGSTQTSLTSLSLVSVEELVYIPVSILQNNCNIQDLEILECNQLQGFRVNEDDDSDDEVILLRSEVYTSSLQELVFRDCPALKFLPDLRGWTSLQKLTIFNCPQVKESLTYDLRSLSFLGGLYVDFIQIDEQEEPEDISEFYDLINLLE